jgi:hypothetical protein
MFMRRPFARVAAGLCFQVLFAYFAGIQTPALQAQDSQARQVVNIDPKIYDAYVGQYQLAPKMLLTLRRERHHFMAQITGQPPIEVFPESEIKFFWKVVEAQFVVEKDKDGKAKGLLFQQGIVKLNAKKISDELPKDVELPEPESVIESPRLKALAKELKDGNRAALAKFWDDMQDKGPLVEPIGGETKKSLVTFVWRGNDKTRRVSLGGGLPTVDGEKWLARLTDTDLWYRTERMPNDARFIYSFQVNRPLKMPGSNDLAGIMKVMEHCPSRLDPFNPRDVTLQSMMLVSLLELPGAPPQPGSNAFPVSRKARLKNRRSRASR